MSDEHTAMISNSDTNLNQVDLILKKWGNEQQALISILLDIQDHYKYLPKEALVLISKELSIPLVNVYSTASFYKVFSFHPKGEHYIVVCLGTACHVRGGPTIVESIKNFLNVKVGETTKDGKFTLETVRCLGACALGPIMVVDGNYHGKMIPDKVKKILQKYTEGGKEQ